MTDTVDAAEPIEELARAWLAAERDAAAFGNGGQTEERARAASGAFEEAVTGASTEELLLAWHAAQRLQNKTEIGSTAWSEARAVSELLRVEYLARAG